MAANHAHIGNKITYDKLLFLISVYAHELRNGT